MRPITYGFDQRQRKGQLLLALFFCEGRGDFRLRNHWNPNALVLLCYKKSLRQQGHLGRSEPSVLQSGGARWRALACHFVVSSASGLHGEQHCIHTCGRSHPDSWRVTDYTSTTQSFRCLAGFL
jgi:hypothetical protein